MTPNISWRGPTALCHDLLALVHPDTERWLLWRVCSLLSLRPDPEVCASLERWLSPELPTAFVDKVLWTFLEAGGSLPRARADALLGSLAPHSRAFGRLHALGSPTRRPEKPLPSLEELEAMLGDTITFFELEEAWRANPSQVVLGTVSAVAKGGLTVDLGGYRAFLPGSQIDLQPVRDRAAWVGRTVSAHILKLNVVRGHVVLSRRAWLEAGGVDADVTEPDGAQPDLGRRLASASKSTTPGSLRRLSYRVEGGREWYREVLSRSDLPPRLDACLRMPELIGEPEASARWLGNLAESDPRRPFLYQRLASFAGPVERTPLMVWLLGSAEPRHRYLAVESLHAAGAEIVHEDDHPLVRLRVVGAAADRGDPEALAALRDAQWEDDPWHEAWIWKDRTSTLDETRAGLDLDALPSVQVFFARHHAARWGEALGDARWWTRVLQGYLRGERSLGYLLTGTLVEPAAWRDVPFVEDRRPFGEFSYPLHAGC